jgi:hypothetical protein
LAGRLLCTDDEPDLLFDCGLAGLTRCPFSRSEFCIVSPGVLCLSGEILLFSGVFRSSEGDLLTPGDAGLSLRGASSLRGLVSLFTGEADLRDDGLVCDSLAGWSPGRRISWLRRRASGISDLLLFKSSLFWKP